MGTKKAKEEKAPITEEVKTDEYHEEEDRDYDDFGTPPEDLEE